MENSDADPIPGVFSTAFWVATVLRIQGYKVSSFFTNPSFFVQFVSGRIVLRSMNLRRCFCAMKALAKMEPETSGWTFAVKRCRNNIQQPYQKQSLLFYIFRFTQWAGVPQKGNPWFPPKASRWPHYLSLTWVNCWIVRQSITTGRSFSWKDWLELALCQQHSIRYPQAVLNFDLISRVKPLPIIGSYLTWFKIFCLPGCLGKCFQLFQERDEVGGGGQDED